MCTTNCISFDLWFPAPPNSFGPNTSNQVITCQKHQATYATMRAQKYYVSKLCYNLLFLGPPNMLRRHQTLNTLSVLTRLDRLLLPPISFPMMTPPEAKATWGDYLFNRLNHLRLITAHCTACAWRRRPASRRSAAPQGRTCGGEVIGAPREPEARDAVRRTDRPHCRRKDQR